jgi:ankyrin repeat protein
VNAPFAGRHAGTQLHWAASSDDLAVLNALIAAGADVETPGPVIDGRGPLANSVAFGQWRAARRLVEHGARANCGKRPRWGCSRSSRATWPAIRRWGGRR